LALPMLRLARNILQQLRPYRWSFAVAVAQVFVMSALELLKAWPLKLIVDHVFTGLPVPWLWLRHLEPGASSSFAIQTLAMNGVFSILTSVALLGG